MVEELEKRNFGFDSVKFRLNRDMEEKGIGLPALSAKVPPSSPAGAAGLPPELRRQSCSSGGCSQCSQCSTARRQSRSSGGLTARQSYGKQLDIYFLHGISLLLKCANISAKCLSAGPQNRIYALIGEGWGSGWNSNVLFLRMSRRRNWLTRLVTVGGVLSEMYISLKESCTDLLQCLYACGSTRDPKQNPKSKEKCFIICPL